MVSTDGGFQGFHGIRLLLSVVFLSGICTVVGNEDLGLIIIHVMEGEKWRKLYEKSCSIALVRDQVCTLDGQSPCKYQHAIVA